MHYMLYTHSTPDRPTVTQRSDSRQVVHTRASIHKQYEPVPANELGR